MEDPQLQHLLTDEDLSSSTIGHAHEVAMEIQSKCQLLELSIQKLSGQTDDLVASLQENMKIQKVDIIRDLEGLEVWLHGAYNIIACEPSRHLYPPSLVSDDILRPYSGFSVHTEEGEGERQEKASSATQNGSQEDIEMEEGGKGERGEEGDTGKDGMVDEMVNGDISVGVTADRMGCVSSEGRECDEDGEEDPSSSQTTTTATSGETEEGGSSESTQSKGELESLGWIRSIHIIPVIHSVCMLPASLPPDSPTSISSTSSSLLPSSMEEVDLENLLTDLEVLM